MNSLMLCPSAVHEFVKTAMMRAPRFMKSTKVEVTSSMRWSALGQKRKVWRATTEVRFWHLFSVHRRSRSVCYSGYIDRRLSAGSSLSVD
jgi:hypothetical protein